MYIVGYIIVFIKLVMSIIGFNEFNNNLHLKNSPKEEAYFSRRSPALESYDRPSLIGLHFIMHNIGLIQKDGKFKEIIGITYRVRHDKKRKYNTKMYTMKCVYCGDIKSTPHKDNTMRRCRFCMNSSLTGYKFNNGTVILYERIDEERPYHKKQSYGRCYCGKYFHATSISVRRSIGKKYDIMCSSCRRSTEAKARISDVPNEIEIQRTMDLYIKQATTRGLDFNISLEIFKDIITKSCHYCGREPYLHKRKHYPHSNLKRVGIDRVDNNLGYNINNIIPCCGMCNVMKLSLSYDDFISQIKLIYININKNK